MTVRYLLYQILEEYDHETWTVELQWFEHIWNHEKMFETGVVRDNRVSPGARSEAL